VMVLAIISIGLPLIASIILVTLFGVALLFSGISKIIHGISDKYSKNWKRGFIVGVGALSVVLAVMILIFPVFGIAFAGLLIGIALLVTGFQMITTGISGRMEMVDNAKDLR
jgi:uncharacterized membrane protein HdeD (DUF308 family)